MSGNTGRYEKWLKDLRGFYADEDAYEAALQLGDAGQQSFNQRRRLYPGATEENTVMTNPIDVVGSLSVVPVIAIDRASDAVALADALLEGGLPVAEITFRTDAAADVLAAMRRAPRILHRRRQRARYHKPDEGDPIRSRDQGLAVNG